MLEKDYGNEFTYTTDLSKYKKQLNKAIKKDYFRVREGYETSKMEKAKEWIEKYYYGDYDYIEEGLFDRFKKKKQINNEPNREEPKKGKEFDGNKVRSDLKKISAEVKKLTNKPEIKKFMNNGLTLIQGNKMFDLTDPNSDVYEAGVDEFVLIDIDLWDCNLGNPREIMNNSDDGWHPIDHALEGLRNDISALLKAKFPDFYLCEYGGDWDTGSITIGLK
jgi:hypothetical protein